MRNKLVHGINIFLLVALVLLFLLCPLGANEIIIWLCLFIFYSFFFDSFRKPIIIVGQIKSYVKIDTFFMLFYYIIYYYPYQMFVLGFSDLTKSKFLSNTYSEYSNSAVLLSTMGLITFHMGFNQTFKKDLDKVYWIYSLKYNKLLNRIVFSFTVLILLLFASTGFTEMLIGGYKGSKTGVITYDAIFSLVTYFIILSTISALYFYVNNRKLNFLTFLLSFIVAGWCLILLVIGDRNTFFIVAIIIMASIFTFLKEISRKTIILFGFVALFLYQVIEISRTNNERSLTAIWDTVLSSDATTEGIDVSSFNITTIGSRATFKIMEKNHDFFYGKFKMVGLTSIIPYSSRIFFEKNYFMGSSNVLKDEMIGRHKSWGTGTNIITDCYMDFGIIGVGLIMYFIGWFGGYVKNNVQCNPNTPKWIFLYLITLGYYSEIARYGFDFPLRSIVWTFVLFKILDKKLKFRPHESNNTLRQVN